MKTSIKKLRLLLFSECDRSCLGCCNKDWDLTVLPECTDYSGYDEIILTGGEPLLHPDLVYRTIHEIHAQTEALIYLYTAKVNEPSVFIKTLNIVDGITLTLHSRKDVELFKVLNGLLLQTQLPNKSLRLNVFSGISLTGTDLSLWTVKKNIKWIKDCPLPVEEVFMRLKQYS